MATNQEKILDILFKSPKTTTELASELNYIDTKGTARYNIIKDDLEKLMDREYIESKKERFGTKAGRTPTLYSINYNIQNLKKMLDEYPNLIRNMQENESALETIIRTHSELICNTTDVKYMEQAPNFKSLYKMDTEAWKKKLKLSNEFFKLFLNNEPDDLWKIIIQLVQISGDEWYSTTWLINTSPTTKTWIWETNYTIEMAFKACVSSDILHRQSKEEARECIKRLVNKISYNQIEQMTRYYKNNAVAPEYLRGTKLIPVENLKLQEIEQEFIDKGGKFV
jgi:alpha-L-arabinofuranosidase